MDEDHGDSRAVLTDMDKAIAMLARFLYLRLIPRGAKNTLRLYLLLDTRDKLPVMISDFSDRHVLVLAPHMDDEIAGCGGAIRKHVLAGSTVTVVYMTDGRMGDADLYRRGLSRKDIRAAEQALVTQRKNEAAKAAKVIGIQEQIFLDAPDGSLEPLPEIVQHMRTILREKTPMVVYLPSLMDIHSDHWATNRILFEAMDALPKAYGSSPIFRGYEVWTPLHANRLVDIGDVADVKKRALEEFKSQTARVDYVRAILSLNAYRSIYTMKGRGTAEAFFETTPSEYGLLLRRFMETR